MHKHRYFGVRVELKKICWFIFEIDFNEVVGEPLFRQDNPCPVSVGSRMARVEFHDDLAP